MIIDRNTDRLESRDCIARVIDGLIDSAVRHQLPQLYLEDMFEADVLANIPDYALPQRNYAEGYYRSSVRNLQLTHCRFVYMVTSPSGVQDAFGLDSSSSRNHFTRLTMQQRREAFCGYIWDRSIQGSHAWFSEPCTEVELIDRAAGDQS